MNTFAGGRMEVLDLFAGAVGAWSIGMHRTGFRTIAACEIDPWRRAIFSHNFPDATMYDDVRSLTADRLLADLGRLPDIIVGSPPCQGASAANTRGRGVDDPRTGLFFEAIRLVGECRPRFCAFENSPRLRTRGYDRIATSLEAIGYAPWPAVVGAEDLGAPHERKRVWIVAADAARIQRGWPASDTRAEQVESARPAWGGPYRGGGDALDAAGFGPGGGRLWRRGADGIAGAPVAHAPHPDREGQHGFPGDGEVAGALGRTAGDPDGARLEIGESLGSDACAQLAALEQTVGPVVHTWSGGAARYFSVAHGTAARLARIRVPEHGKPGRTVNAARACIAAQGDAILPQIAEAIGRAIMRVDAALAGLYARYEPLPKTD